MYTMFDILQSQGDASVRAFGQQFGLTPEQTKRAMEALLPALSLGLQRNAADPMGIGRMFGLDGGARPPSPPDLLGGLFGSPMLSQAVLQQAAAASGVGTHALRQMLPVMAGMIVAAVVHMLLNQQPPAAAAEPAPAAFPMGAFWTDWLNGFAATAAKPPAPAAPPPPRRELRSEPPRREEPKQPDAAKASLDAIQQMLQTGAEVQEQNVKAMKNVFDAFWSAPPAEAGKEPSAPPTPPQAEAPPPEPAPTPRKKPPGKG